MSAQGHGMDRTQRILGMVEQAGVLRPRDLDAHGIPRIYLGRLCLPRPAGRSSKGCGLRGERGQQRDR